eukprot:TRINITY_DN60_c4_g1_i1.p1 TRINITY_DN60_c4_g1~~TRINITY_DN60_c4_g1_i1.p1  ORF type:complete len:295 (+),score=60.04 TRINITY_DN60_c4_g1_i1:83-886(+)
MIEFPVMDNLMREGWGYVVENTSEVTRLTVLGPLTYYVVFWCMNIPLLVWNAYPEWSPIEKYKIQKDTIPGARVVEILKNVLINQLLLFAVGVAFYLVFPSRNTSVETLPSFSTLLTQLLLQCLLADFSLFTMHMSLHTKWMYKHIHAQHHSCSLTIGIVTNYMHPVDYLMNVAAAGIPSIIVSDHAIAQVLFAAFFSMKGVFSHCGYNLPFTQYMGDSRVHDFHHSHATYGNKKFRYANMGALFHISDHVFGTLCEPWNEKKKNVE